MIAATAAARELPGCRDRSARAAPVLQIGSRLYPRQSRHRLGNGFASDNAGIQKESGSLLIHAADSHFLDEAPSSLTRATVFTRRSVDHRRKLGVSACSCYLAQVRREASPRAVPSDKPGVEAEFFIDLLRRPLRHHLHRLCPALGPGPTPSPPSLSPPAFAYDPIARAAICPRHTVPAHPRSLALLERRAHSNAPRVRSVTALSLPIVSRMLRGSGGPLR